MESRSVKCRAVTFDYLLAVGRNLILIYREVNMTGKAAYSGDGEYLFPNCL